MLKWVTSFPVNPRRGLPTVTGVVLVSDADTGEPLAMLDARAVTALRTGAAAAVAAQELAREDARTRRPGRLRAARHVGRALPRRCGVRARRVLRPGPGRRRRRRGGRWGGRSETWPRRSRATSSARSRRAPRPWSTRPRCVPGQHLNLLGADGPGKAEATVEAIAARAGRGPDLLRRVGAGLPRRRADRRGGGRRRAAARTSWSWAPSARAWRPDAARRREITLFDSTGLAIQDLAIALGALEALRAGAVKAQTVSL